MISDVFEVVPANQQNDDVETSFKFKRIEVNGFRRAACVLFLMISVCVETTLKIDVPDVSSTHGLCDIVLE